MTHDFTHDFTHDTRLLTHDIYGHSFGMRVFRFLRLSQMYVERINDLKVVDIDRSVYKYKPSVDGTVELHAPYIVILQ